LECDDKSALWLIKKEKEKKKKGKEEEKKTNIELLGSEIEKCAQSHTSHRQCSSRPISSGWGGRLR
jgi:hypothetical protein